MPATTPRPARGRRSTIPHLDEWLSRAARARPHHPAVVSERRAVSYAELESTATRTAHELASRGVRPGDRVATTLGPGHSFAELLHALPKLGAALVPLDPRNRAHVDARLVIHEPLDGVRAAPDAARAALEGPLRERIEPEEVHSVILTSGTTGVPKAVELTYGNHWASALGSAWALGVDPDDRWLCPLPLFHVGGLAVLLRSVIYGTTAVLHERFDAARVKKELESGAVTLVSLVPTMLRRLRDAGLERAPALRAALVGGGPVPPALLDWAVAIGLPVEPTYGMTEAASQIATGMPARPLPGVELRIAGDGEVLVRGPMVAPGALAGDGWLHTGDRGRLDAEGHLHVEGRLKDLIVTGGEKVSPREVEDVLLAHPDVLDAAVVGLPDDIWGEAVSAFVVLRGRASAADLLGHCRARLAAHKVPKRVEEVRRLPRTPAGKPLREELVALAARRDRTVVP